MTSPAMTLAAESLEELVPAVTLQPGEPDELPRGDLQVDGPAVRAEPRPRTLSTARRAGPSAAAGRRPSTSSSAPVIRPTSWRGVQAPRSSWRRSRPSA